VSEVTIVHAIPGRVRLRIAELRTNPAVEADVRERLSRIRGVRAVETNLVTGSVVVRFDTTGAPTADYLRSLGETFPALQGGDGLAMGSGNGHGPHVDRQVVDFFRSLNTGVGTVTSGVDLKVLVPLTLFFLGVRSLVVSDRVPFPNWYDYFWFGLSTFIMLNGAAIGAAIDDRDAMPASAT
jgi:copper chaperone CopZ